MRTRERMIWHLLATLLLLTAGCDLLREDPGAKLERACKAIARVQAEALASKEGGVTILDPEKYYKLCVLKAGPPAL